MRSLSYAFFVSAMLFLAGAALAQVTQLNTGQGLDANYQIGSGGYNTVTGGRGGVNPQLYITGQVSGLAAFRGRVPLGEATNQLQANVPSAALGDFVRVSVGVPQALTGSSYATTPYYNPSRTSFGVTGILTGQTGPGTNAAIGELSPTAIQRVYSEVTRPYMSIAGTVVVPGTQTSFGEGLGPTQPITVVSRPGVGAMFGVPQYNKETELALDLRRYLVETTTGNGRENPTAENVANENQTMENSIAQPGQQLNGSEPAVGGQVTLGGPTGRASAGPPTNQDAFLDLLLTLQKRMKEEDRQKEQGTAAPKTEEPAPGSNEKFQKEKHQDRTEPLQPGQPDQKKPKTVQPSEHLTANYGRTGATGGDGSKLVESSGRDVVIHQFAGRRGDMFNAYMARAQRLLKEGRYYDSMKEFELAMIVDRANPMPRLGACLAIFGAGEPFTAASHLKQGMAIFPPLMETRVDVDGMMSVTDYHTQLTLLDQRITSEPSGADPLLLFLATYLHSNVGETQQAKHYAQLLQASGEKDKFYQAYATYILTGKRPGAAKATSAPAPAK